MGRIIPSIRWFGWIWLPGQVWLRRILKKMRHIDVVSENVPVSDPLQILTRRGASHLSQGVLLMWYPSTMIFFTLTRFCCPSKRNFQRRIFEDTSKPLSVHVWFLHVSTLFTTQYGISDMIILEICVLWCCDCTVGSGVWVSILRSARGKGGGVKRGEIEIDIYSSMPMIMKVLIAHKPWYSTSIDSFCTKTPHRNVMTDRYWSVGACVVIGNKRARYISKRA